MSERPRGVNLESNQKSVMNAELVQNGVVSEELRFGSERRDE